MPLRWWDELGDDELLRRLHQRGVPLGEARRLVATRDWASDTRAIIDRLLR